MLIQEMAGPLIVDIAHWVNVLLIIAIIAKLFVLLKNAFGGMSFGGLGGDSDDRAQKKADKKAERDAKKKEKADKNKDDGNLDDFYRENGLDPSKKGKVKFRVVDSNGNPIMRALVIYWPARINKKSAQYKKFKNFLKKKATGLTLPSGYTSNYELLPEGEWSAFAIKYNFNTYEVFNKWNSDLFPKLVRKYKSSPEIFGVDGETKEIQIVQINMKRDIEEGGFSPEIMKFGYEPEKKHGYRVLKLSGKIH